MRRLAILLLVAAALAALLLPTDVLASTSIQQLPRTSVGVTMVGPPLAPPATLSSRRVVLITAAISTLPSAGTQAIGTPGLAGTLLVLPSCVTARCAHGYRGASAVLLKSGDYAVEASIAVQQPVSPSAAVGIGVDLAVETTMGWSFAFAYFSTGSTTHPGGSVVTVHIYLDLGVTTLPTLLASAVQIDRCSSATGCP